MATCIVLRNYEGWRAGDHVEAEGERLNELISLGVVADERPVSEETKTTYGLHDLGNGTAEVISVTKITKKKGVK